MKVISDRSEIERCQEILINNLRKKLTKPFDGKIKGQSKKDIKIAIHNDYLWFAFKEESDEGNPWNAFGLITSYSSGKIYNIIAEINSPKEGINPNTGGVFAEDEYGELYILHRGNFQKVSKKEFLNWWRDNNYKISELYDGQENEVIFVSLLEDDSLVGNITSFVEKVHDFKENY